ncbi:MAG: riboflavin biosynthesis protein RibF [Clostridia bacterium]|nr:riboflavin biosynthesis protein RibF [Clostridia bacterium]
MSDKVRKPTVVALGYFDSLHAGHRKVIAEAEALAQSLSAEFTVFTFDGNLRAALSLKDEKYVYSFEERKNILKEIGVKDIFAQPVDFNYLSTGKLAFLNNLNRKFDIKGYVCGKDYRFGKFGKGTAFDLEKYAVSHGQVFLAVDTVSAGGKKISTSRIKTLLAAGDVETANSMLVRPYSFTGAVLRDRGVGRTLGFPTANIAIDENKQPLKAGVYAGHAFIDGARYSAVVNFGDRPTFDNDNKVIEAHFIGFDGDLYGKTLTVFFDRFIRNDRKFFSEEELKKQLQKDAETVKNGR